MRKLPGGKAGTRLPGWSPASDRRWRGCRSLKQRVVRRLRRHPPKGPTSTRSDPNYSEKFRRRGAGAGWRPLATSGGVGRFYPFLSRSFRPPGKFQLHLGELKEIRGESEFDRPAAVGGGRSGVCSGVCDTSVQTKNGLRCLVMTRNRTSLMMFSEKRLESAL